MRQNMLYSGTVRHRRFAPKTHEFKYKLYYFYLNPNDISDLCKNIVYLSCEQFNYLSFKQKNYIGGKKANIYDAVEKLLSEHNVTRSSDIYMMAQLAHFGYCFNPISLYFTYEGDKLQSLIADVHNTPWGEKHAYVLTKPSFSKPPFYQYQFKKALHVSPFMQMDFMYHFNVKVTEDNFVLHMKNMKQDYRYFDATLNLTGEPLTTATLKRLVFKHPLMAQKIVLGIYWQACKLFLKQIPFVSHP